jgi:hypothetical protein
MPVISPPSDEPDEMIVPDERGINHAYVKWFMNVPSWKCACGLTNHGRNERCADWRCRLEKQNER